MPRTVDEVVGESVLLVLVVESDELLDVVVCKRKIAASQRISVCRACVRAEPGNLRTAYRRRGGRRRRASGTGGRIRRAAGCRGLQQEIDSSQHACKRVIDTSGC